MEEIGTRRSIKLEKYLFKHLIGQSKSMIMVYKKYQNYKKSPHIIVILLTKITAVQNEVALTYHRVRGQSFMADAFAAAIAFVKCYTATNNLLRLPV